MQPLKSFVPLWCALSASLPGGKVSTKSTETYLRKSKAEDGLCFNTVHLPKLGKAIYISLETGKLPIVPEFKFRNGRPVFLKELFSVIYDAEGNLRDLVRRSHMIRTLHKLLQLCMMFYKYEDADSHDNTSELVAAFRALQSDRNGFLEGELSLKQLTILSKAKVLIHKVLGNFDPLDIKPFHGSGAVKTGEPNWEKWKIHPFYTGLERHYPSELFNYASATHFCDDLDNYVFTTDRDEIGVRIVSVPKNSSTRRMIAVEEAYPQYLKMGIMAKLYDIIESHTLTKSYVNFTRQEINQEAACLASIDKSLATLDLSSASDTVHKNLVLRLFPRKWSEVLLATRATFAEYEGERFELNTFATMGSSTCFPVEALVFWAIASAITDDNRTIVYGDDIIIPATKYNCVVEGMESLGFKINTSKSYVKGFFRESCGGDFFYGHDIATVKLIHEPGNNSSTIQFINNISDKFGESASIPIYDVITSQVGFLPFTTDRNLKNCGVVVRKAKSCNNVFLRKRLNKGLQRYEFRIKIGRPSKKFGGYPWFETLRSMQDCTGHASPGAYDDNRHITPVWCWVCLYPEERYEPS